MTFIYEPDPYCPSLSLSLSKVLSPTRHILGHFGDGGVTVASARIIAAASPQCVRG